MKNNAKYELGKRQSLPDELAQIITRQIADGEYAVGEVLPSEQALAEYFKVSRPVVREALARLKYEGLVESKRGSGAIVCQRHAGTGYNLNIDSLSMQELGNFIEFRMIIEGEAAFRAALRRTEEQLALMEKYLNEIEISIQAGGSGTNPDFEFHCLLATASGNPYLADFLRFVAAKLWLGVYQARYLSNQNPEAAKIVLEEHKAVFEAVKAKNADRARLAMQGHLTKSALRQGVTLK